MIPTAQVLTFGPRPGGGPPRILVDPRRGTHVRAPAGGPPMRVLRDPAEIVTALRTFPMAQLEYPLTGAEVQDDDGGLMVMDGPAHAAFRRPVNALMMGARAVEDDRVPVRAAAERLVRVLNSRVPADLRAALTEPFAATIITRLLGVPDRSWDHVQRASQMAFGVVAPGGVPAVRQEWRQLYRFYDELIHDGWIAPEGMTARIHTALLARGFTSAQAVRTIGTVSNGAPALVAVLAVAVWAALRNRDAVLAAAGRRGGWAAVAGSLLRREALFPLALPRRGPDGEIVLPSLVAAAAAPGAPPGLAFGAGPHFCPGAAFTRLAVAELLRALFTAHPAARLGGEVVFGDGTLAPPISIPATLA